MAASAPRNGRWLFGPAPDLLLGCGLWYVAAFALFSAGGPEFRARQPGYLIPLLSMLISMPHYGGTLLRVYEHRSDRRSYAIFSVWATLIVAVAFLAGVWNTFVASCLLTLYITWSPWHYTGQNYGICVMFLRRRGVEITPVAKRLLYGSFLSSYLLTFLALHGGHEVAYNAFDYAGSSIRFIPLAIPVAIGGVLFTGLAIAYLGMTATAAVLLSRRGSWRALGPSAALVATQALWFSVPFAMQQWQVRTGLDPIDAGTLPQYVFWIAMGHAAQYLWVTTYYARASRGWRGFGPYLGKTLLSGAAIWTVPVILFAPDAFGRPEYSSGLALLVASSVNIHHFILDGAIWKLRQSKIASVLIRPVPQADDAQDAIAPPRRLEWVRPAVWTFCGASLAVAFSMFWLDQFAFNRALRGGQLSRAAVILDGMAWFGRDSSTRRTELGLGLVREGDVDAGIEQLQRSLALRPSVAGWIALGRASAEREEWPTVIDAYGEARALDPRRLDLGQLAIEGWYALDQPDRARALMDEISTIQPESAELQARLGGVARRLGDPPTAVRFYRRSLQLEPSRWSAVNNLAWILATSADPEVRDPTEAVRLAGMLVRSGDVPDPNHLDTLAAAYAAVGRFKDAHEVAEGAAALAAERGETEMAEEIRVRAQLYRVGRSVVDPPAG